MFSLTDFVKKQYEPLILCVFAFIAFYAGLGSYALENVNEGLYAEIPREMLQSHQWIIPHLNFLPYIEKPPLLYWLTALSYSIFGLTEFAARLIPALSASMTVLLVYRFMRREKIQAAFLSALMLTTSLIFILLARVLIFDMLLCALMTLTLLSFHRWYTGNHQNSLRISYSALALALMTKGLVVLALIPAIAFSWLWWEGCTWKHFKRLFDFVGIGIFLVIALPWHIAASLQLPDFAWQYFMNEHVMRFLNKRIPNDYHHGPWYFYLLKLPLYIAPWSLFLPVLSVKTGENSALTRLLWLWLLVPLIFFSFSQAKGDYYLVISMPALVMLLAMKMHAYFTEKRVNLVWSILGVMISIELLVSGILVFSADATQEMAWLPQSLRLDSFLVHAMEQLMIYTLILSVVILFCYFRYKKKLLVAWVLMASLMIAPIDFLVKDKKKFQFEHSTLYLSKVIRMFPAPVYLYRDFEEISTLNFYTQQRVRIVDSISSDLYYGSQSPKAKSWFISIDELKKRLKKEDGYIVTKDSHVKMLLSALKPLQFCEYPQGRISLIEKCNKLD